MQLALETFVIEGVATTMPFLARVMQHPQFQAGDVDTKWLEREVERIKAELARPEAHAASLVRDHA
jgi:acetyl-CoA carboxylase biotin carboxylase subunit